VSCSGWRDPSIIAGEVPRRAPWSLLSDEVEIKLLPMSEGAFLLRSWSFSSWFGSEQFCRACTDCVIPEFDERLASVKSDPASCRYVQQGGGASGAAHVTPGEGER
jgi:hypothetical protein